MKTAYDACVAAGVDPPDEVSEFFNGEMPDPSGVMVDLDDHDCVEEYNEDMVSGYEIDLTKLPEDINRLRFYNSY